MIGRWRKVLAAPAYMMAAWTAPYKIVEDNLSLLFWDAAAIFLYLRDELKEDWIDELTEVQLLYLMQAAIREQYSYNHFKGAIESAVSNLLEIPDTLENRERIFYSLAFAALVGIDIEEEEPLRVLVKDTKTNRLPPALALGLDAEGRTDRDIGDRFRKLFNIHRKRMTKALKKEVGLREYIRNFALVPIKRAKARRERQLRNREE